MVKKAQSSRGGASKGATKESSRKGKSSNNGAPGSKARAQPAEAIENQLVSANAQLELRIQQLLLDLFARTFSKELADSNLDATLQAIKGALYSRDFEAAFSTESHLASYACRWSPTRSLCYASILEGLRSHLGDLNLGVPEELGDAAEGDNVRRPSGPLRMLSIGGGAAELAAFSTLLMHESMGSTEIVLADSGPWASVVGRLYDTLTTCTARQISKYTKHPDDVDARPVVAADSMPMTFSQVDVLSIDKAQLAQLVGDRPLLITILFTLNELYTSGGIGKTTTFLLNLSSSAPVGTLLLVVDSPGSYSETGVGAQARKYPMQWLLHHTLSKSLEDIWERIETSESTWFRLKDTLTYPIPLENMRYQLHLYRLVRSPDEKHTPK